MGFKTCGRVPGQFYPGSCTKKGWLTGKVAMQCLHGVAWVNRSDRDPLLEFKKKKKLHMSFEQTRTFYGEEEEETKTSVAHKGQKKGE